MQKTTSTIEINTNYWYQRGKNHMYTNTSQLYSAWWFRSRCLTWICMEKQLYREIQTHISGTSYSSVSLHLYWAIYENNSSAADVRWKYQFSCDHWSQASNKQTKKCFLGYPQQQLETRSGRMIDNIKRFCKFVRDKLNKFQFFSDLNCYYLKETNKQ